MERVLSSEELAKNVCTNPVLVRRVMSKLKKAGIVETKGGNAGGYLFAADAETLTLEKIAQALNVRFVDAPWHSGDLDEECLICSGMAGVMDALYRSMNEQCAAYLSQITIADIEIQLFTQK